MSIFAGLRVMGECRARKAEERARGMHATEEGQGKSACHTHRKPLMRLGFFVAGGSVACGSHDIRQGYQASGVAGMGFPRRGCPQ